MTRKALRAARRTVSASARRSAALALTKHLATDLRFIRARRIAFYMASDGEIDVSPLMRFAAAQGKDCYLPIMVDRMHRFRHSPLVFQQFDPQQDPLVRNRWGLLEPPFDPAHQIAPRMLDLLIMPLVGFDWTGNRVGMGKGYFDRTLAGIKASFRRPRLIGAAFALQEMEDIRRQPWDVTLDGIVTENSLYWVGL